MEAEVGLDIDSGDFLDLLSTIPLDLAWDLGVDKRLAEDVHNGFILEQSRKSGESDTDVSAGTGTTTNFTTDDTTDSSEGFVNKCKSRNEEHKYNEKERKSRAAACRKSRMKRKLEQEKLVESNRALEAEQEKFRSDIASLQYEIQTLKNSQCSFGGIDFKTENMLLRAEVKRHKVFIHHIKAMMSSIPEYSAEEKLRLANSGIDSGIGQVLGLCYTSIVDRSWHSVQFNCKGEFLKDVKIVIRYQYLPFGSTLQTATRLNIRQDTYNMPIECETLKNVIIGQNIDLEKKMRKMHQEMHRPNAKIEQEFEELDFLFANKLVLSEKNDQDDVNKLTKEDNNKDVSYGGIDDPEIKISDGEKLKLKPIKVFRYIEKDLKNDGNKQLESLELRAYEERMVNALGFPSEDDPLNHVAKEDYDKARVGQDFMKVTPIFDPKQKATLKRIPATVVVHTQASSQVQSALQPQSSGTQRIDETRFDGWVLRPGEDGTGCTLTGVCTIPLNDEGYFVQHRDVVLGSGELQVPRIIKSDCESMDFFMAKIVKETAAM